jgi:3-oxoacyl-[acyl-carrier protein] reductase
MGRLNGRTALVTGAGGGIGAAIAERFAAEGAAVLVTDVDFEAAERIAAAIILSGGVAEPFALNVTDRAAADAAAARAAALGDGVLNIVVNNAGLTRPAMFPKLEEPEFRLVLDVHVVGLYTVTQAALPHLPEDGTGRVINVTSAAGLTGTIGQANYGAAKAAVVGLTKSLAKELARRSITVNAVAPLAATAMTENIRSHPKLGAATLDRIPLGRWAEPAEIAGAFVFFASDDASYVTGQVLPVDGGTVI